MKTQNIILTVYHNEAMVCPSMPVYLTGSDESKLRKAILKYKEKHPSYTVGIDPSHRHFDNALNVQKAIEWLNDRELSKMEYILDKVTVKVINLPDGVTFNPAGYLEVKKIVDWDNPQHEDCLKEIELSKWILDTFPTSKFVGSRARFALPSHHDEYFNAKNTIKWVFSISASGNKAVEVTKRIYKKVITTI